MVLIVKIMCFGCNSTYYCDDTIVDICKNCTNIHNYGPVLCDSCNVLFVDTGDCYSCDTCIKNTWANDNSDASFNICKNCGDSKNYTHHHEVSQGCCCGCDIVD